MGEGAIGAGTVEARDDAAGRLAAARAVLRRGEDRAAGRARVAEPGADGRLLPVVAPLAGLLPAGGLRRGSTVAVTAATGAAGAGATSLLTALLAGASAAGAWVGVVGRPELGLVAAAEAGVALERLALVPYPGADLVAVTAALLDGLDAVAVAVPRSGMAAPERQRLAARARQRGAVLLPLGPWPGADAELSCAPGRWQGVDGRAAGGLGRLCARPVRVRVRGRGVAPAGRAAALLLPGPAGPPVAAADLTTAELGVGSAAGTAGTAGARPYEGREAG